MTFPYMVDQVVAQAKFTAGVSTLRSHRDVLQKRGWIIKFADYPYLMVAFADLRDILRPNILAVLVNYENYNMVPPSVRLLNPETYMPIKKAPKYWHGIINSHAKTRLPFLCVAGTREFHSHPEHDNQPWDLFRYSDDALHEPFELINTIWSRCVKPIFDGTIIN